MPNKSSNTTSTTGLPTLRAVDETQRLEALRNYQILDTPPEKVFDDLTQLAAYICGTPVSAVSLIDADRQWFKANTGLDGMTGSAREHAFCSYAMFAEDIFEIEDVTQNSLFSSSPLVMQKPNIRFYAGAALLTPEGLPLGSLCAMDTVPRRLKEEQRAALRVLAQAVVSHLELRRARLQLEEEKQKIEGVLRMTNDAADSLFMSGRTELFVKQEHRLVRVCTTDIAYVEALGDYVNIYTERERFTVYSTMKELETKLPARYFARVHRKYIVRLDRIQAIETDSALVDNGKNSLTVPIGNSYKNTLLSRLNLL